MCSTFADKDGEEEDVIDLSDSDCETLLSEGSVEDEELETYHDSKIFDKISFEYHIEKNDISLQPLSR